MGSVTTTYDDPVISVKDWSRSLITRSPLLIVRDYLISLFPILTWIYKYNFVWGYQDFIAGVTVGAVLVPQGMSYAKIATLAPQYGLYSSFVGVFIYCFFATSKDVSIGPVAVMSLQVSKVIAHVQAKIPEASGPEIATSLALICGAVAAGLGLLRLGFILEFISVPAVMGFMSGSAFTIVVGQVPGLLGISSRLDTRAASYKVAINTLKNLKYSTLDAAFGFVPLFILYLIKFSMDWVGKRYPKYKKAAFFFSTLRLALVVIFATLISWGVCKDYKHGKTPKFPISILKTVPSGLKDVGPMTVDDKIFGAIGSELPVSIIVLLLEHIAISKSFGRVNGYKISPDQEIIAIGVTNLIGTFFHAYPATGSFSRSALKAKAGVRTPLAGLFTGAVVLIAIYALTGAFYWIPNATLSAVIIHAVSDLVASYKVTWKFWKTSPVECSIFIIDVFLTVFISIEVGVYFSIAASAAWMLVRIAKAKGRFLGRIAYITVQGPSSNETTSVSSINKDKAQITIDGNAVDEESLAGKTFRYKWVALDHYNVNPALKVTPPPPGILVYSFNESFMYPNGSRLVDDVFEGVEKYTKTGLPNDRVLSLGERPWNDPHPRKLKAEVVPDERPVLRKLYLDFSASPLTDATAIQYLVDLRTQVNKYADDDVEIHIVGILTPWIRRALISHGFGGGEEHYPDQTILSLGIKQDEEEIAGENSYVPVIGTNTPFFHVEIPDLE